MPIYRDYIYPRLVDMLGDPSPIREIRGQIIPFAEGKVLEIGVGSGANFPHVCRSAGLMLLLEHGHSSVSWLAKHQDRHVFTHYQQNAGCRWNQDPLDLIKAAGLNIVSNKRFGFEMFHTIVAVSK